MKLSDMRLNQVSRMQQIALMRLQLRMTADTHTMYGNYAAYLRGIILRTGDGDGMVSEVALLGALPLAEQRWREMVTAWSKMFEKARVEATSIPFGSLVVMHNAYMRPLAEQPVQEDLGSREVDTLLRLWEQRRQRALDVAARRVYSDGFDLSGRVWRLEQGGLDTIRRTLTGAMVERTSAVQLARQLEQLLGAGQGCPRWAYSRLYGMTPAERVRDATGLLTGEDCQSTGLAYNALRMARNELQIAHHAMTTDIFANAPWVEGEKIRLSTGHSVPDICDEYAAGGPYAVGEVVLPLHIACMCYSVAVLMQVDAFRQQVRGWLGGQNKFLDGYSAWLGVANPAQLIDWAMPIAQALELWSEQTRAGHAAALGVN